MLRQILQDLEWGLTLAIATLILLIIISLLNIQHAIATITEIDIAPGLIHCREELLREIPLEKGKLSYLHRPQTMVKKWQEVAGKLPECESKITQG